MSYIHSSPNPKYLLAIFNKYSQGLSCVQDEDPSPHFTPFTRSCHGGLSSASDVADEMALHPLQP